MKFNKIIFSLMAAFSLLAVSCQEEIAYTPGEPDLDGCYGVYFSGENISGKHVFDPEKIKKDTIWVKRVNPEGDITVPFDVVASEDGIFNVSELSFVDGQTESFIVVSFDKAKAGVEYSLSFEITDPEYASKYGNDPKNPKLTFFSFSVIVEKWIELGEGLYMDYYFSQDPNGEIPTTAPVKILQNEVNPNQFRITDPFVNYFFGPNYQYKEKPAEYFEITILEKDEVFEPYSGAEPVIIPLSDLIWYDNIVTGYVNSNYDDTICYVHPGYGFNDYMNPSTWSFNKVLGYQDDGLPIAFQLAPFVYMWSVGGWDFATAPIVTILFPGAKLTDYSISLQASITKDGKQPVEFSFGSDIQTIRYAAYAGMLSNEEYQEKVSEVAADANAAVVTKPAADEEGNVPAAVVNLSFDKTGVYTLVAVGYDKDNAPQNTAAIVLEYVAAGDEMPVMVSAGLGSADKYVPLGLSPETAVEFYVYGKEIKDLKLGLFAASDFISDYAGCVETLVKSKSASADVLAEINGGVYVDVLSGLTPGTEYYLLVYASNGYEETVLTSDPLTTAGDPLPVYQSYGMADIVDDLLPATSEGYFGTWNYYAKNLYAEVPQTLRNYQGQVTVSDSEMPDIPAEEDPNGYGLPTEYVDVKGLFAGDAEYWGFDDTMPFEFYGGVMYTVAWGFDATESGYYPASMYATPAGSLNFYNSTMVGAYVSEGYVAFVDATGGQILPELYLGMFADEAYSSFAGVGAGYSDLLLINPENDDNGLAPEAAASAMSMAELDNIRFNIAADVNYVETERGRIRSAIDRVKAAKRTPQAVGNVAGVEGEWEAPAVEFKAEDAGHIQVPVSSPVYKKASNAAQRFIR